MHQTKTVRVGSYEAFVMPKCSRIRAKTPGKKSVKLNWKKQPHWHWRREPGDPRGELTEPFGRATVPSVGLEIDHVRSAHACSPLSSGGSSGGGSIGGSEVGALREAAAGTPCGGAGAVEGGVNRVDRRAESSERTSEAPSLRSRMTFDGLAVAFLHIK